MHGKHKGVSVCACASAWLGLCVCACVCPKAENMVVIKMTEYEGEVPLEGWVAAHLEHRHTHMHKPGILADVTFQRLTPMLPHLPLTTSLLGIKPASSLTSFWNLRQTTLCSNHRLNNYKSAHAQTVTHLFCHCLTKLLFTLCLSLTHAWKDVFRCGCDASTQWLVTKHTVLYVFSSPPLFWLPAWSAKPH